MALLHHSTLSSSQPWRTGHTHELWRGGEKLHPFMLPAFHSDSISRQEWAFFWLFRISWLQIRLEYSGLNLDAVVSNCNNQYTLLRYVKLVSPLISLLTGGLPTRFLLLNVQKCLINCRCQRKTVSGFTNVKCSLRWPTLLRMAKTIRSEARNLIRLLPCFRLRITSSFCWREIWTINSF